MTNNLSDFQTILWPATKVSNVGFYKKPSAGFTSGQVIEAPFTRSGAGRKVIDASGNLVDAAANVPAWTFPIGGSSAGCPYLSFLPSVENLQVNSEDFDSGTWAKPNTAVTANVGVSPDGTTNADLVYPSASGSDQRIQDSFSFTSGVTYTTSVFLKAAGKRWVRLYPATFSSPVFFDLENGVVGTVSAGTTANIIDFGNGWYHCAVTRTATTTGTGQFYLNITDQDDSGSVVANGTDGILMYGAQIKQGSYISPLDYVKTEASAVTRSVDRITNISDLQGDGYLSSTTEGSVIFQVSWQTVLGSNANRIFSLRSSVSANLISFVHRETLRIFDDVASDYVFFGGDDFIPENSLVRLVYSWNASGISIYYNGFLIYSASGSYPIERLESLAANTTSGGGGVNFKMLNFAPTALTASQAEAASSWPSFDLMVSDLGYS